MILKKRRYTITKYWKHMLMSAKFELYYSLGKSSHLVLQLIGNRKIRGFLHTHTVIFRFLNISVGNYDTDVIQQLPKVYQELISFG
jgi:hypothetical protein